MKFLLIYITVALVLPIPIFLEKQEINVVLKYIDTFSNKKYVEKIVTKRKPVNRTASLISKDIYFQPNVSLESHIYIQFVANKKFRTEYKPIMYRFKVNLCDHLKGRNHPYYRFLDGVGDIQNNFYDPCPLKGHRFIKPHYPNYDNYLPMVPVGMWRTDVNVTKGIDEKEELVFGYREYYEITAKGIIEF